MKPFGALIHCVKSSHTNVKNFWRCTVILNNTNKTNWSSKHDHSTIPQNRIWTSFENIKLLFPSLIINVCTTMFCFSLFWRFSLSSYSTCFLYLKLQKIFQNVESDNLKHVILNFKFFLNPSLKPHCRLLFFFHTTNVSSLFSPDVQKEDVKKIHPTLWIVSNQWQESVSSEIYT